MQPDVAKMPLCCREAGEVCPQHQQQQKVIGYQGLGRNGYGRIPVGEVRASDKPRGTRGTSRGRGAAPAIKETS